MSETVMLTSNPYARQTASGAAARSASRCRACAARARRRAARACPTGEIGEHRGARARTCSRATGACPRRPQEEFTADGWFKTGDVGKIDGSAATSPIVGRSKDLIISGGYNVYPAEIEGYINDMPGVAESAVIGVPHPDFGEAVVAVVVAEARRAAGRRGRSSPSSSRSSPTSRSPSAASSSTELPRNAMGKVQKNVLREQYGAAFRAAVPGAA